MLARLQFATTVGFHWLFVILTLGLAPLVAVLHTRAAGARDPGRAVLLERMTRFWGQLYLINYALGIVTGLVMEFQFGLSWSGLSKFAGNVFGAPLALETLVAFFAESTFLGMWIFGWGRLGKKVHVTLIWLVTATAYASAYWILVANGFMQNPVGYTLRPGPGGQPVAHLTDLGALLTNPSTLTALAHIAGAAMLTGGLFMAGISAYHLRKKTTEQEFFKRSLRLSLVTAAVASWVASTLGHLQQGLVADIQPVKFPGDEEFGTASAQQLQDRLVARHGPGDYIPPEWLDAVFFVMFPLGELLTVIVTVLAVMLISDWIFGQSMAMDLLVTLIPLPFVVSVAGWVFREVGRQPWIVYGQLKATDAVSPVGTGTMLVSFVAFSAVFAGLAVADWILLARYARRGPSGTQLGAEPYREPVDEPALT